MRLQKFTLKEGDLTDGALDIRPNRSQNHDILHLPRLSQLRLRHRHIHASPKQMLQKEGCEEMRKLIGSQEHTSMFFFFF
jgi:hypothetical protein